MVITHGADKTIAAFWVSAPYSLSLDACTPKLSGCIFGVLDIHSEFDCRPALGIIQPELYDLLITLVLAFSLLLLIRNAVLWMRGWFLAVLSSSLQVQAKTNLFSHLINLPAAYFETRHLGDVMSRFRSQDAILKTITTELIEAVLDGLMAFITVIVMLALSPALDKRGA